jgi:transposase
LYLAFDLGNRAWKSGFTTGLPQTTWLRTIDAGDPAELQEELRAAKERLGLPEKARISSCYQAGRDGFRLVRYLAHAGIENLVVDSASMDVNRRRRGAKTDRLDVGKLVTMLVRHHEGDRNVRHVVRVPSVEAENGHQLHRELESLKEERAQHTNRIKGLLAGQGIRMKIGKEFARDLDSPTARSSDSRPATTRQGRVLPTTEAPDSIWIAGGLSLDSRGTRGIR